MMLDEIGYLIASNSTAWTTGTNLFKGYEPANAPDTSTFLHEHAGPPPEFVFSSSTPAWEQPRLQVVNRSTDYQTAMNNAQAHYKLLIGQVNTILKPSSSATGVTYLNIEAVQSPFYLGQDDNARHRYGCNYETMKPLST